MTNITVKICTGTTCYVMGASQLLSLPQLLPEGLASRVLVEGANCLDFCKNGQHGKAPFVQVNNTVIPEATIEKVKEAIRQAAETD
ncbi:MAG: (2Fe-2S) ferredoxin domain-containing protein [Phycisphaerales bacterium]|jgi:NADH:ubiquinone oxidoreductase subunit E|nr:(2Fe-2S) ferredoxin domain-containing protein [Phycisphaerales bacterium]